MCLPLCQPRLRCFFWNASINSKNKSNMMLDLEGKKKKEEKKKLSKGIGLCTEPPAVQVAKSAATCSLIIGILGLPLVWLYKCLGAYWAAHLQPTYCHLKVVARFWLSCPLGFVSALCVCLLSIKYFTTGCSSFWSLSPGNIFTERKYKYIIFTLPWCHFSHAVWVMLVRFVPE